MAAAEKYVSLRPCHTSNGTVDDAFVQFYPTQIPVSKAEGTLKPGIVR